jgi:hypothetical protein
MIWRIAAMNGYTDTAAFLLNRGADILGCKGFIDIRVAVEHGHTDIANLISQKMNQRVSTCSAAGICPRDRPIMRRVNEYIHDI